MHGKNYIEMLSLVDIDLDYVVLKSNSVFLVNIDGNIVSTTITLIKAPLDISAHIDPIIAISEYNPTPNVAAKKHIPLMSIDGAA